MHTILLCVFALATVFTAAAGAETASVAEVRVGAGASLFPSPSTGMFGSLPCRMLGDGESAGFAGGDVRMRLNAARNRLTVNVIDNEYEARLGRIPPRETYEVDVHNRIVATRQAPFYPSAASAYLAAGRDDLTCMPAPFPDGNWLITGVRPRSDNYGPVMISSNAVGRVNVFEPAPVEGGMACLGEYGDTGYALHSNANPFDVSRSNGCLIVRQEDAARIAASLAADRADNPDAVQTLYVPEPF